jgi:hypothetical protein
MALRQSGCRTHATIDGLLWNISQRKTHDDDFRFLKRRPDAWSCSGRRSFFVPSIFQNPFH